MTGDMTGADDLPSAWVSVAEATGIIGKSERTIRRWIAEKRLLSRREGQRLLVDVSDYRQTPDSIIDVSDRQAKMAVLQAENDMLRAIVDRQDLEIERLDRQNEALNVALASALQVQQRAIEPPKRRFRWPWQRED